MTYQKKKKPIVHLYLRIVLSLFFIFFSCFSSHQISKIEQKQSAQSLSGRSGDAVNMDKRTIGVDIPDIVSVSACADLTLPPGAGLCIDTIHGQVFMVSIMICVSMRILYLYCLVL